MADGESADEAKCTNGEPVDEAPIVNQHQDVTSRESSQAREVRRVLLFHL